MRGSTESLFVCQSCYSLMKSNIYPRCETMRILRNIEAGYRLTTATAVHLILSNEGGASVCSKMGIKSNISDCPALHHTPSQGFRCCSCG